VLVLKGTTIQVTGLPLDLNKFKTDKKKITDDSVLKTLALSMDKDSQKAENKKKRWQTCPSSTKRRREKVRNFANYSFSLKWLENLYILVINGSILINNFIHSQSLIFV